MSDYSSQVPLFGATITRANTQALGAAGVLTKISWDTIAANAVGFAVSGGDALLLRNGSVAGHLYFTISTGALLTGVRVVITYDPGGPNESVLADLERSARTVGNSSDTIPFAAPFAAAGKVIRTELATLGLGSLGLDATPAKTKLSVLWLGA